MRSVEREARNENRETFYIIQKNYNFDTKNITVKHIAATCIQPGMHASRYATKKMQQNK